MNNPIFDHVCFGSLPVGGGIGKVVRSGIPPVWKEVVVVVVVVVVEQYSVKTKPILLIMTP